MALSHSQILQGEKMIPGAPSCHWREDVTWEKRKVRFGGGGGGGEVEGGGLPELLLVADYLASDSCFRKHCEMSQPSIVFVPR